jgi:hypothetical protein
MTLLIERTDEAIPVCDVSNVDIENAARPT